MKLNISFNKALLIELLCHECKPRRFLGEQQMFFACFPLSPSLSYFIRGFQSFKRLKSVPTLLFVHPHPHALPLSHHCDLEFIFSLFLDIWSAGERGGFGSIKPTKEYSPNPLSFHNVVIQLIHH